MTNKEAYSIRPLDDSPAALTDAVNLLYANCPCEFNRYEKSRLIGELCPTDSLPFYKKFFGAYDINGILIAVGGVKAADWASDTHILYLMAVDQQHRGKGVGSDLERARIQWLRENFAQGRCLVSSTHKKRFVRWDFKVVNEINGKYLMVMEF